MPKPRRIRITHIHKGDACYGSKLWMGAEGAFIPVPPCYYPGYYSGYFRPDSKKPIEEMYFLGIRYKRI